jgi:hypothetical protein
LTTSSRSLETERTEPGRRSRGRSRLGETRQGRGSLTICESALFLCIVPRNHVVVIWLRRLILPYCQSWNTSSSQWDALSSRFSRLVCVSFLSHLFSSSSYLSDQSSYHPCSPQRSNPPLPPPVLLPAQLDRPRPNRVLCPPSLPRTSRPSPEIPFRLLFLFTPSNPAHRRR